MLRHRKPLNPAQTGREAGKLEANLHDRIVGQDEAVRQIVEIYQTFLAGMNPSGRPIASLLFLGPTGTGKTRLVEATAESVIGDARGVIKIDCAEFQHSHEIAKLIGAPPGYLGHRETQPLLSQEALDRYHCERGKLSLVLFDEIEKASDALWKLLLGILDKATLTLGDNGRVDFSQAMIFMTSNLGAGEISSILSPRWGFMAAAPAKQSAPLQDSLTKKISRAGLEATRRKFTPEFINRVDSIIVFNPLGESELRQILDIELKLIQQRVHNSAGVPSFVFTVTEAAKDYVLGVGTDRQYGARHIKRALERLLVQPLSNLIATRQVRNGDWVRVDFEPACGHLSFYKEAEEAAVAAPVGLADTSVHTPNVAAAAASVTK